VNVSTEEAVEHLRLTLVDLANIVRRLIMDTAPNSAGSHHNLHDEANRVLRDLDRLRKL
jgi:hypothetical protein